MTLAIGHLSKNAVCVLDALLEIRPPLDPEAAVAQCAALLRRYGVTRIFGDKYAGEWPRADFASAASSSSNPPGRRATSITTFCRS